MELAASGPRVGTICTCGTEISYPEVYNTGVRPNERAAERLRYRAFRAAGLVKNLGGFAIGMALLGLLFFPLALCGAVLGIYTLTMVRGPLGRYSGRRSAIAATIVGVIVFATEGGILWSYLSHRRADRFTALQASAADDLRTLLRTERLYKAAQDRFGTIKESRYAPRGGHYTIYLALDDYIPAFRDGETITDRLPSDATPKLSDTAFTAFAVANLDGDSDLDVWMVDESGELRHVHNDVPWLPPPRELSAPPGQDADGQAGTLAEGDNKPGVKSPTAKDPPKSDKATGSKTTPESKSSTPATDDKNHKATPADDTSTKLSAGAAPTDDKLTAGNDAKPNDDKATAERAKDAGTEKKAEEPPAPKPVPFKLDKPPLGNPSVPPVKPPSTTKPAADPQTNDKPVTPT